MKFVLKNMYSKPFYITENIGNNSLSFEKRENPKIYVPSLKKINDFSEIKLLKSSPQPSPEGEGEYYEKITFQDFGFDGKLSTNFGLENFYEIEYFGKKIYLFDNHNHALYFWYLAKNKGKINSGATLYHIDEHADYREPKTILEKTDLENIFKYTNFSDINVGNYIIPAEKEGLIGKTVQIRNTQNLEDYLDGKIIIGQTQGTAPTKNSRGESCIHPMEIIIGQTQGTAPTKNSRGESCIHPKNECIHPKNECIHPKNECIHPKNLEIYPKNNIILNLDLDFFQPDLDFIDYELKKKVVLDIAEKADVITVSTSPFFINQELAIKVFKDLFYK